MLDADIATADGALKVLTEIMLHFPQAQFIEVLRSTCRRAIGLAADATGTNLHKVNRERNVNVKCNHAYTNISTVLLIFSTLVFFSGHHNHK